MTNEEKQYSNEELKKINEVAYLRANILEEYHKKITTAHSTDYIKRMQPYFNAIVAYKKKHKIKNNIQVSIELCKGTKSEVIRAWILATAVEMTINEKIK